MTDKDGVTRERWDHAQKHEAEFWQRVDPLGSMHRLILWHEPAIRAVELFLPEDARIIEIGSGPTCIARLFAKGEKVYADPLMDMFREHMSAMLPEGETINAPGEELPFEDESFDAAVCVAALDHVMSTERVLEEIARVLKPGGKFILGIHTHNALLLGIRRAIEKVTPKVSSAPHPNVYTRGEIRADLRPRFEVQSAERVHYNTGLLGAFHREYWVYTLRRK